MKSSRLRATSNLPSTKSCHLAHAGVRLDVIDPKTLTKTLRDEPSFKSVDESVSIWLYLEDVPSVNRSTARRKFFELVDAVVLQVGDLLSDGLVQYSCENPLGVASIRPYSLGPISLESDF